MPDVGVSRLKQYSTWEIPTPSDEVFRYVGMALNGVFLDNTINGNHSEESRYLPSTGRRRSLPSKSILDVGDSYAFR